MLAGAAVLVALLVLGGVLIGRDDPVAAPAPSVAGTSNAASPTPSPSATLLAGFADCGGTVGRPAQCGPTPSQCWGGLISTSDSPYVATSARCDRTHVYETFAAGVLAAPVVRQSQLDDDAATKQICTRSLVNKMLPTDERRDDWEIYAIPPQSTSDEAYFRCVFGRGERSTELRLTPP